MAMSQLWQGMDMEAMIALCVFIVLDSWSLCTLLARKEHPRKVHIFANLYTGCNLEAEDTYFTLFSLYIASAERTRKRRKVRSFLGPKPPNKCTTITKDMLARSREMQRWQP